MAPHYQRFLVARGASNRPLVMHIRTRASARRTLCGRDVSLTSWRIDYTDHRIDLLLCRTCKLVDNETASIPSRRLRLA